jgi:D-3-phosphoglycerate dehydrogenase
LGTGAELHVLICEGEGFDEQTLALLRRRFLVQINDISDRAVLLSAVKSAEIIWTRLRHYIDGPVLESAPRLRAIVTATTGLNHIDLEAAEARRIAVLSLKGETKFLEGVRATAEHTVGLLLALLRQIPAAVEDVRRGGWNRDRFRGRELFGKTVGVVGYGRLGKAVGRMLRAFDMEVVVSDPHRRASDLEPGVRLLGLDELLREVDMVTLHANLTPETRGLIGRRELERMKPGAWLVNTARGELIDEDALLDVLRSGRLAAAALDVLSSEHRGGVIDNRLVAFARENPTRLLITPHLGGCTSDSMARTERFLAEKLLAWVEERQGN